MIKQANYLGIVVKDLAAATAFYRDTLGIPVDEGDSIPGYFTQSSPCRPIQKRPTRSPMNRPCWSMMSIRRMRLGKPKASR